MNHLDLSSASPSLLSSSFIYLRQNELKLLLRQLPSTSFSST